MHHATLTAAVLLVIGIAGLAWYGSPEPAEKADHDPVEQEGLINAVAGSGSDDDELQ